MSDSALLALVMIVFILTFGGTILLRPLTKRLADYLDVKTRSRLSGADEEEIRRLREALEATNGRLALLEERQDFTDRMLARGRQPSALFAAEAPSTATDRDAEPAREPATGARTGKDV